MKAFGKSNDSEKGSSLAGFGRKWLGTLISIRHRPRLFSLGVCVAVLLIVLSILSWSVVELRNDVDSLQRRTRSLSSDIESLGNQLEDDWSKLNSAIERLDQRLWLVEGDTMVLRSDVEDLQFSSVGLGITVRSLGDCVDSIAEWVTTRNTYYIYC